VSTTLPDNATVEMSVTEHVHEAWRPPFQEPDKDPGRVTEQLPGCYSWSEVEADATTSWRASVGSLTTEPNEAEIRTSI